MKTRARFPLYAAVCSLILLAGCSSAPPPPDWKMNATSLLEHFQNRWLQGDGRAAGLALENARKEVAKTGRLDLLARLELAACGTQTATLDFSPCPSYAPLETEALPAERSYARFISGDWAKLDASQLPAHYTRLLQAGDEAGANQAARAIADALPRLIATGLLFKQGRAHPETIEAAARTASDLGWRRPLLVWLEVQRQRAMQSGDPRMAAQLLRRIELVQGKTGKP